MNVVISQRTTKDLKAPQTGNRIIYDSQLGGFGVRITASGAISFILTYWVNGRQRRFTIGRHPELTATAARAEAVQLRELIRRGGDPLAEKQQRYASPTVADLAHDYLERHAKIHKRVAAANDDAGMLRNIILPKLGKLKVAGVERRDIEEVHSKLKDMPYRANRVLALLSKMMNLAIDWGWRADNPCRRIPRFQEEKRDRWLSTDELERLCTALDKHSNQVSANAVRLLLLTGARRGEVLSARWEEFDLERGIWTKPSHHTKQKRTEHVPLSAGIMQLLVNMKKQATDELLFPGQTPGEPLREIKKFWSSVRKIARIKDARLHDLRHTYASHLVSAGMSLPIVGRLLGHTQVQTTARYAHLADDPLRQATNRFASILVGAQNRKSAEIIPLRQDG
jgi:integrase